jgi:hypothetical protein
MTVVDQRNEMLSHGGAVRKKPTTPQMGPWKIKQLTQMYKKGVLDWQEFVDARAKIVDEVTFPCSH